MNEQIHSTLSQLSGACRRDIAANDRATTAGGTRNVELRRILALAAQRRLVRLARGPAAHRDSPARFLPPPVTDSAEQTGGGSHPRGAPTASRTAPVVLSRQAPAPDLLKLRVTRPAGFDYRPGQHVKFGLPGLLRTYSLVSAPHEAHLEFFVELFAGGRLSERLRALQPGAVMTLGERAKGHLAVDPGRRNQLLVATVTGIAPYLSFLRHELRRGAAGLRFVMLHGASHSDELGYLDELTDMARRQPRLVHYLPTISRPGDPRNASWPGATGRVEAQLEATIERFGLTPSDTAAFACGNPGMVRNVARVLRDRGFPVQTEPFD